MEDIFVSSPGKLILHGEHAVVYGKKAIAASLDLRTVLRLQYNNENKFILNLPDINIYHQWSTATIKNAVQHLNFCDPSSPQPPTDQILQVLRDLSGQPEDMTDTKQLAVIAALYLMCGICSDTDDLPSITVTLQSKLPTGAGLGSSAAYGATLAASLLTFKNRIQATSTAENKDRGQWSAGDLKLINSWAFQAEKIIHGNPSGIDNSVSTYGGGLIFQKGNITPLSRIPPLNILLMNTQIPRSTKVLVSGVRERYNRHPDIIVPILDSIEAITTKCEAIFNKTTDNLTEEDYSIWQELIDINHKLLGALGVSHPSLDHIHGLTAGQGLQSKLTGAGGGGCAFALLPPGYIQEAVESIKHTMEMVIGPNCCWKTQVGGLGVTQHFSSKTLPFDIDKIENTCLQ